MEKIIVLSRCISVRKNGGDFHFRGFFLGHKIKKIKIHNETPECFELRSDYILYLEVSQIRNEVLWGKCLKVKNINSD